MSHNVTHIIILHSQTFCCLVAERSSLADNGTWPFYPNQAGRRWIDLVKGEWNSTQDITIDGPSLLEVDLYFGDYEIIQQDRNGDILHIDSVSLVQTEECSWSAGNMVNGEFDNELDMTNWQVTGPDLNGHQNYKLVNFDAYAGNAFQHTRSNHGQIWLSTEVTIEQPAMYTVSFMSKWDFVKQLKLVFDSEEIEILSKGEYLLTPWTRYEAEFFAEKNGTLILEFVGIKVRFLICR